jgi:hypothetical protein
VAGVFGSGALRMTWNPVNPCTDAAILDGGGSPEAEVAAWWNRLERRERVAIGMTLYMDAELAATFDWSSPWEHLCAVGQQMRIHMWYDDEKWC